MFLRVEEEIQKMLFKVRWLYNWFVKKDYHSGQMIGFYFRVQGLYRLENIWKKHMQRKLNERYNKNS